MECVPRTLLLANAFGACSRRLSEPAPEGFRSSGLPLSNAKRAENARTPASPKCFARENPN